MKLLTGVIIGIVISAVVVFSFLPTWRQGIKLSGNVVTETRDVSGFNKISVAGSGTVMIEQGEEESLSVEADEKLMEYIKTEASNDELQIKVVDRGPFVLPSFLGGDINYHISVKDVEKISLSGSVKLESSGITTDELELTTSGSGDVRIEGLKVEKLTAKSFGSGTFTLTGAADQQEFSSSGSGKIFGKELEGKGAEVSISGSGRAELNVSEKLDVSISGSGLVRYLGDPEIGKTDISGSGKIEKMEE